MGGYEASLVEATVPDVELVDPTPFSARSAVRVLIDSGRSARLAAEDEEGLIGAVSEVVTNALVHGVAPVLVRGWVGPERIVVTVHDRGAGPADADVGAQPDSRGPGLGGFGLWLAHELCAEVAMGVDGGGFTVRLATAADTEPGDGSRSAADRLQAQVRRQAAEVEHPSDRR